MSHDLDITEGIVSFADSRTDAWHQLGQQVGHLMTAEEVIREAQLGGWNVRKIPVFGQEPAVVDENGVTLPAPIDADDKFMTVRTNPVTGRTDYLGVVGKVWHPIQNEETAELLNAIVDEGGAHFETAGALDRGRRTFVTMKLPQAISVTGTDGKPDDIDIYLAATNSHDGNAALSAIVTPVRIVCANTEAAALRQARSTFSIRHTASAATAVQEARNVLGLTWKYVEEFESEVRALAEKEMSDKEFVAFANALMGVDDAETDRQRTSRREHVGRVQVLWTSSPTLAGIRGSRWGAYNAITEYADHYIPVRPVRGTGTAAEVRARRALEVGSASQSLKTKAFAALAAN